MKRIFLAGAALVAFLGLAGAATAAQTVKLGVVGSLYEDMWAPAKEELAKEGIDLEFVPFTDYVTPNRALSDGDIELNAFQHDIYLQNEIKEYGYKLTNIGGTFIEAMNIFSQKVKSISEIKDGDTVAIPYNGSVARLNFGTAVARRARKWLEECDLDLLHIHEPITPSVGMLALQAADGPVVATFHAAMDRSLARELLSPMTAPLMERISAMIAVSEEARRTLIQYHGGDAVVIPNGINVAPFACAPKDDPRFRGTDDAPTISFLGRLDEPRKGLRVLADAIPTVLESVPRARFLIAGRGQAQEIREELARFGDSVVFLGGVSDEDKAAMLASATCYVAPQTGGESFGIVLVEAMSARTAVVASGIEAFRAVLGDGRFGVLFETGSAASLADELIALLGDPQRLEGIARAGEAASLQYDWEVVADKVYEVYKLAIDTGSPAVSGSRSARNLIRGRGEEGR